MKYQRLIVLALLFILLLTSLTLAVQQQQDPVTINAYKVVCEAEEYLPNWALSGMQPTEPQVIDGNTAADFVAANDEHCWLEEDWEFQWGYSPVPVFPGNFIGPAPTGTDDDEWKDFDTSTNNDGLATVAIYDLKQYNKLWFRENLQVGYVPFSNPPGSLQDPVSAEMLCRTDALHFDNYDWIQNLQYGETYNCVAFNAIDPMCGDEILNQETEQCDGDDGVGANQECSDSCMLIDLPFCGDNVVNQNTEECDGSTDEEN
jgi:hypothetical protein